MTDQYQLDTYRTLLLLRKNDQVLLALKKRGFGVGKWNGVGGKLEADETIEQAMIRECQEEILVTPTSYQAVAELDFVQDSDSKPWHMHVYVYLCDQWDGTPTETEEMAPRWFALSDIPYDQMWDDDRYWLEAVLSGDKVIGRFSFDSADRLIEHNVKIVDKLLDHQ